MLFLTATTDKLQLTTSAAATVDVHCSYIEAVTAGLTTPTAGRQHTAISTATTTDILGAPGASNTRTLKQMTARNKHATLTCDVTVIFDQNGTDFELHKVTLLPGETLEYIEGVGFFTLKPAGVLDVLKIVASDVINATTSFADITGLTHPLLSGIKYAVQGCLFTTNDASTTGSRFGYNIGAAPTLALFGENGAVTNSVTALASGGGTQATRDVAIVAQTTGQTAIGFHFIAGHVRPSGDGTFALRVASEIAVAAGVTVKAGSWMWIGQEH